MIVRIFTCFDNKAQAYLPPFFMPAAGLAVRAFGELVNDTSHSFGKHPEDYSLWEIGTFNDANAEILHHQNFINLGNGQEHLNPEQGGPITDLREVQS